MSSRAAPLLLLTALLAAPAHAAPEPRDARHVVYRGARTLHRALEVALGDALEEGGSFRPVALVVDVTPNTRRRAKALADALRDIGGRSRRLDGRWRIGPLGGRLLPPVRHAAALALQVESVVARDTRVRNTLTALSKTLVQFRDAGGVVVYLADWHFEDDQGLEPFIARLERRRQSFRVVGSEAAHGRPWLEPFYPEVRKDPRSDFAEGVGRCPFLELDPEAPWHGGDTAYPHMPWHFRRVPWCMEFTLYWGELTAENENDYTEQAESLNERVEEGAGEDVYHYTYPLASSWGPYGLMRAAAVTGGRYVLWSWNPRGRKNVTYDYSRCNLLAPDLRSRARIRADIARRPLLAAMARAWTLISEKGRCIAAITPPIDEKARKPRLMDYSRCGLCARGVFHSRRELDWFQRVTAADVRALDEAARGLDAALEREPEEDGVVRRYRIDAEHFRHVIAVLRFQLAEALLATADIPADAWDDPDRVPRVEPVAFVQGGDVRFELRVSDDVVPRDPEAGATIVKRTFDLYRRYEGTPVGEIVFRNSVYTFRVGFVQIEEKEERERSRADGTPSESDTPREATPPADGPPPLPPGGSAGGGPATGG